MIISKTPLRISFFGGGTDFPRYYQKHGGCVLSTTIDKYVYVIVKPRYDKKIYLSWSQKEIVGDVNDLKHELIRECLKIFNISDSIEITTLSDIPSHGSGLGSSSAVTVGTLNALHCLKYGNGAGQKWLARMACEIELDILGKPIGKQDQYAVAHGGFNHIKFGQKTIEVIPMPLGVGIKCLQDNLMLFYSGIDRKSETVLQHQNEQTDKNLKHLNALKWLALNTHRWEKNLDEFGVMLHENWELKRELAWNISNTELDSVYLKAIGAGAIGGKLCGAGGGGYFLFYVPKERQEHVRKALQGLDEYPFGFEWNGSEIIYGQ